MPPEVAAAVLAAALLHASWHALVKSSGDRVVALAGMNLVSGSCAVAVIPFVAVPPAPVLAIVAGSVLLHGGYKLALSRLYLTADLSQAYPLARGITPLVTVALGALLLGERPGGWNIAGIAAISAGILGLVLERPLSRASAAMLLAALAAGGAVAAYSVIDAYGVRLNGDWLGFTAWLLACDSAVFIAYAIATRGAAATATWRAEWGRTLVSGLLGTASFSVFIWALGRAQVGAVSALRETSIVFSALLGVWLLKERMSALRFSSATLVAAGIGAIALAR